MKAVAFSQRIPPVQYMAIFGLLCRPGFCRTHSGNSRKVRVFGSTAPRKMPMAVS